MKDVKLELSSKLNNTGAFVVTLSNKGTTLASGFKLAFSLLAPAVAKKNCKIIRHVGGYHEVEPIKQEALAKNKSWQFVIDYQELRHKPLNVSWGLEGVHVISKDNVALAVTKYETDFGDVPLPKLKIINSSPLDLALLPTPVKFSASGKTLPVDLGFKFKANKFNQLIKTVDKLIIDCGQSSLYAGINKIPVAINLKQRESKHPIYEIKITYEEIKLSIDSKSSLRHALISLAQLRLTHLDGIPCGIIYDYPRFNWRGMHLDTARHFYSVASIKRVLNLLALLKINKFHWHMIEDEAFRIELKSYPQLQRQTAYRGHNEIVPGVFGGGIKQGGYYSYDDVNEIIKHANELAIEVMPELELPAHAYAILKVFPEMLDPLDKSGAISVQGYRDNVINPAMPFTWKFLETVLGEFSNIFNGENIHLGGDEIPPKVWTKSPALKGLKAKHNLKTPADIQEWFMHRVAKIVSNLNKRPAAWADAAEGKQGGIRNNSLLFAWLNYQTGIYAAKRGYEVVMCPAHHTYLDMAIDNHPSRRGMNWAKVINCADTVSWEPVPDKYKSLEKKIVGVQGAFWSETILQDQMIEPMLAPRILGIAETAWAQPKTKLSPDELFQIINLWKLIFGKMSWQMGPTI